MITLETNDLVLMMTMGAYVAFMAGWLIAWRQSWKIHHKTRKAIEKIDADYIAVLREENDRYRAEKFDNLRAVMQASGTEITMNQMRIVAAMATATKP